MTPLCPDDEPRPPPLPAKFEKITWDMIQKCSEIDSLEDPMTQAPMQKSQFYAIYRPLLDELDGQGGFPDSYVSFFFERQVPSRSARTEQPRARRSGEASAAAAMAAAAKAARVASAMAAAEVRSGTVREGE